MRPVPPRSVNDPSFLEAAGRAIAVAGERLALERPANHGGVKVWRFVRSFEELERFIASGRAKSSFTLFPGAELPTRGRAEALVGEALRLLAAHGEVLMVELNAAGEIVDDASTDDPEEITGYVPDADSVVRPGAY
jgi:hypothetical protein